MDRDSFYRPSGNIKDTSRTYVPDMYRQLAAEMLAEGQEAAQGMPGQSITLQRRPLIGVLYSISAGIEGELFPLYAGRNTIGSDPSCDICLRESSVSEQHGILLARKQTNENGEDYINVSISDSNSYYGTQVNGERLNYEKVVCTNGDIISIGQNYDLLLSLFLSTERLSVAPSFDRLADTTEEKTASETSGAGTAPQGQDLQTHPDQIGGEDTRQPVQEDATIDFYKPSKKQGQDHYNNKTIIL